ncbi:MAG: hypothetical protein LBI68_05305 [Azoarcus sp.]|jgi:phage shock protein PspC (stress-responsive transcriptional regulator)|nr:hypothetical protein [Azoarcus sp.]
MVAGIVWGIQENFSVDIRFLVFKNHIAIVFFKNKNLIYYVINFKAAALSA